MGGNYASLVLKRDGQLAGISSLDYGSGVYWVEIANATHWFLEDWLDILRRLFFFNDS